MEECKGSFYLWFSNSSKSCAGSVVGRQVPRYSFQSHSCTPPLHELRKLKAREGSCLKSQTATAGAGGGPGRGRWATPSLFLPRGICVSAAKAIPSDDQLKGNKNRLCLQCFQASTFQTQAGLAPPAPRYVVSPGQGPGFVTGACPAAPRRGLRAVLTH